MRANASDRLIDQPFHQNVFIQGASIPLTPLSVANNADSYLETVS
jgi:hypothetical protein